MLSNDMSAKSEQSAKMDSHNSPDSEPQDGEPAQLTEKQIEQVISTWKVVKDEVTLQTAGLLLFKK